MIAQSSNFDHPKKAKFLAAFAECGTVLGASKASGVSRSTHWEWLRSDPDYPDRFADAKAMATEKMEDEARRRAIEGWDEAVFYEGVPCGSRRKFSDTLLIFMLKGAAPEKYRDRIEHSGPNGGPMEHRVEAITEALQQVRDDPHYAKLRRAAISGHCGESGANGNGRQ